MQDKAPIRSHTVGPAMLGERRVRSTGQRQGILANPSTGQIGPAFWVHYELSIPAVAFSAHAGFKVIGSAKALPGVATVL